MAFEFLSSYVVTYKQECKFWQQFSKECMLLLPIRVGSQDSLNKSQKSKKTTTFSFSILEYIVD